MLDEDLSGAESTTSGVDDSASIPNSVNSFTTPNSFDASITTSMDESEVTTVLEIDETTLPQSSETSKVDFFYFNM